MSATVAVAPVRLRSEVEKPEDIEILYWVGCCVSADDRVSGIARSLARILNAAGVRFAVLGGEEHCCGDPARRTGNEYNFEILARANIETFERYGVTRIVAHCPHCVNTLRNEYPRFGGMYEVLHHSQLVKQLLDEGRLKLARKLPGTVVFHDPCYLARYDGVVAEPRAALDAAVGARVEMKRSRERTFCCGGGGGHSFFEAEGGERINRLRARQAIATGAQTLCTACPYCLEMMEDGVRTAAGQGGPPAMRVRDVAEIVAEALGE